MFEVADRFRNRFAPLGGAGNESTPIQHGQNIQVRWNAATVSQNASNFSALSLDDKLSIMFAKLENLETNGHHLTNMASQLNHTTAELGNHTSYLKKLAYHSIDQEARSRRNNLIFYGLADCRGEDVIDTMSQFLSDFFDLDLNSMGFQRIHRLGSIAKARTMTQYPRRPIIVAFIDYRDTETIMSKAFRLAGTQYGVDRDHPKEIAEARKSLWNFKKEQRYSARDKVSIQYPAKLVVNGTEVRNEFPDWHTVLNESRLAFFKPKDLDRTVSHTDSHLYSVATDIDQRDMSYSDQSSPFSNQSHNTAHSDSAVSDTSRARAQTYQSDIPPNRSPPTSSRIADTHVPMNNSLPGQNRVQLDTSNMHPLSNREPPPSFGPAPNEGGDPRLPPNGPAIPAQR